MLSSLEADVDTEMYAFKPSMNISSDQRMSFPSSNPFQTIGIVRQLRTQLFRLGTQLSLRAVSSTFSPCLGLLNQDFKVGGIQAINRKLSQSRVSCVEVVVNWIVV